MLNKKGQIAVFVIVGVVILIIVSFVLYTKTQFFQSLLKKAGFEVATLSNEVEQVNNFVENCLEQTGYDGIYLIGQQGGYYNLPELSTKFAVPYYFYNNRSFILSKQDMELELSSYVNRELFFCTRNFVDFPGLLIGQGRANTAAIIEDERIFLDVDYHVIILKGSTEQRLKEYRVVLNSTLGKIHNVASEIIEEQLADPSNICLSCILDLSEENELLINMEAFNESVLFTIVDNKTLLMDRQFEFRFANRYG